MRNESSRFFIGTNVLLYLRDRSAMEKHDAVVRWYRVLETSKTLVISPQVLNEYCNVILTKYRDVSHADLRESISAFSVWCTAVTDISSALRALKLRSQMHVRFYDAVLLSSALHAGCSHFLSEDLQHDRMVGPMRIVNPFLTAPESLLEARG